MTRRDMACFGAGKVNSDCVTCDLSIECSASWMAKRSPEMTIGEYLKPGSKGLKYDQGKQRPELVIRGFANALKGVTRVATFGSQKYTDDGWQGVENGIKRYTDALYRHLLAHHTGEKVDAESGLPHLEHAAWNALAILELSISKQEESK
jgi:hypothetical protein